MEIEHKVEKIPVNLCLRRRFSSLLSVHKHFIPFELHRTMFLLLSLFWRCAHSFICTLCDICNYVRYLLAIINRYLASVLFLSSHLLFWCVKEKKETKRKSQTKFFIFFVDESTTEHYTFDFFLSFFICDRTTEQPVTIIKSDVIIIITIIMSVYVH